MNVISLKAFIAIVTVTLFRVMPLTIFYLNIFDI